MTLEPGTTLGRYQILAPLGQGGMATVYKAYQPSLDREVALKVLRPGYAQDQDFLERFEREAKAIARLRHPHIVQVFDFEMVEGHYALAMEFLEGGTLKDRLASLAEQGKGMEPSETARIVSEVADALSYAHELGIVHRDIKPSNVMLTRKDRAVVTDFGIAKILSATSHTQTGVGIGTPDYMAPEQGQGAEVDHRADIYSLGAMAYELLVGRVPYVADTPLAVVLAHMKDPLPLPSQVNPTIGPTVERALLRALAKDPAQRFAAATDFAEALRDGLAEDAAGGTVPTMVVRAGAAAVGLVLASFWARAAAQILDAVIIWPALFVVLGVSLVEFKYDPGPAILLAVPAYFLLFWSRGGGQTLGMRVLRVRVSRTDGSPVDFAHALIRYLGLVIGSLPLGLGVFWAAIDEHRQGWHDRMADTMVVRVPRRPFPTAAAVGPARAAVVPRGVPRLRIPRVPTAVLVALAILAAAGLGSGASFVAGLIGSGAPGASLAPSPPISAAATATQTAVPVPTPPVAAAASTAASATAPIATPETPTLGRPPTQAPTLAPAGTASVTGSIRWNGEPVSGVPVDLSSSGSTVARGTTDTVGNFRFAGLAAGTYRFGIDMLNAPGGPWRCASTLGTFEIVLPTGGQALMSIVELQKPFSVLEPTTLATVPSPVKFWWQAFPGATSYRVTVFDDIANTQVASQRSSTTDATISGLAPGTRHSWSVTASNGSFDIGCSPSQRFTTSTVTPAPTPTPAAALLWSTTSRATPSVRSRLLAGGSSGTEQSRRSARHRRTRRPDRSASRDRPRTWRSRCRRDPQW